MPADDEDDLLRRLGDVLAPEDRTPDPARVAALRAVAERTLAHRAPPPAARRLSRWSPAVLAAAAAVAIAVGIGAVAVLGDSDGGDGDARAGAVVEFETTLRAPEGPAIAEVTGIRTGIGRIVELRSEELAILPKGEYYEVWFVGPGDEPGAPNRISAGTFHPDEQGRTDIELTAAVDPAKYPALSVTAEPGDGDPRPSGVEVLRATVG